MTIDKELLCVVATLREFHSMLLSAELHVHTDQRLHWISFVDEYGQESRVKGPCNVIADIFARLLWSNLSSPLVGEIAAIVVSDSESNNRNKSSH
jgi:hypothetical protein